jgi:pimeloyl-ACP methyl ester carboxylesterase
MPFVSINTRCLEYQWFGEDRGDPAIVMLHEGLGSVAIWKDLPIQLSDATGRRVLAYSRYGYGKSDPIREKRTPKYLHDEALETLPSFLSKLGVRSPVLFGHSDGASIALIHAGANYADTTGVIALAPHVFVETMSLDGIRQTRGAYLATDLRHRLARYHQDPDSAFWGWNDIWLDERFRSWNIEEYLPRTRCPILAIQGVQDEYGTLEQVERIVRLAPRAESLILDKCGHSPQRDQTGTVLDAVARFVAAQGFQSNAPAFPG